MLTNEDIWRIALRQSAYDSNCAPEDFLATQNVPENTCLCRWLVIWFPTEPTS